MHILAVDPGEKRLGIAISDSTGTIANPLTIIKHVSRPINAATIAQLAGDHSVKLIIVGATYDDDGELTPQGRRGARLAEAIMTQTDIGVALWDESNSTQAVKAARIAMGSPRSKRKGHLDDLAATYILQTYLDFHGK